MSLEHKPPRIIPVLDVMNGQVVRAIGGRRDEYKPIASKLTASTEPVEVAKALLGATGASELYVADLDAITGVAGVAPAVVRLLESLEVPVWVDAGIGGGTEIVIRQLSGRIRLVVGLESAVEPELLRRALAVAREPVAFSLDLRGERLLGNWSAWGADHERAAFSVARTAVREGAKSLIVLDLARVGTGTGTGTESLLRVLRDVYPDVDLIAGGGVRTWEDVKRLGEAGASGVLVASALHDGTLI